MQEGLIGEASGKQANRFYHWPSASLLIKNGCFVLSADREFRSRTSSLEGAGGAAGASSFLRFNLFINLIAMKMANATMMKSKTF